MKCAVLMSVLLHSSFFCFAQDDKVLQSHRPEFNETSEPRSFEEPETSSDSFVQKIVKSNLREFSVPDFSNEQLREAFQNFGNKREDNSTNLSSVSEENEEIVSTVEPAATDTVSVKGDNVDTVVRLHGVDEGSVLMNVSGVEGATKNKQLNLKDLHLQVNSTGLENITIVLQGPNNETFDQGYFEVIVPDNVVRNETHMRSILESVRDSVNEATNLGRENIVESDNVEIFTPSSIDRSDRILVNKGPTPRRKSGRKYNHGKRYYYNKYGRAKKRSKKRSKNKKIVDSHKMNEELKYDNKSTGQASPHSKQDRRMAQDDFPHPFGLSIPDDVKSIPDFPYKFEPIDRQFVNIDRQYAEGFPHTNYSRDVTKALFEPHHDQVSRTFTFSEPHLPQNEFHGETLINDHRPLHHESLSTQFFERKNEYGPVTFGIDHNPQAVHDQHNHGHEHKTITLTKEIPVPYTVKIEKPVPYPIYVKVPYDKPYPVIVPKPYRVVHEVFQPYHIQIKVPKPYKVIKQVPTPVKVPVERPYPVAVPKPYQVTVEKNVPVVVEKRVPYPVHVPVDRPYPVHVTIPKHVPYTVEKKYPVRVNVPVDKPYPVYIPKPYAVHVNKPVPHPVEKHVPYPVQVPVRYPVNVPVPYQVLKHVPVYEHRPDDYPSEHY